MERGDARETPLTEEVEEWEQQLNQVVYVSATPGDYELEKAGGEIVEQVIRPTGLLDPVIEVVPATGQVPHLLEQIRERAAVDERVLVTTLTKRLAEDLSAYLVENRVRCKWLHSELDAFERVDLLPIVVPSDHFRLLCLQAFWRDFFLLKQLDTSACHFVCSQRSAIA